MPSDHEPRQVDFQTRATEAEWQKKVDAFYLRWAPQWFEWLGWAALLGGLHYLDAKVGGVLVKLAIATSLVFIWGHANATFFQMTFRGFPFMRYERVTWLISLALSGVLATCLYLGARHVAALLGTNPP